MKEWDVQFSLAARDAFLISASMEKGQIEFVEILSQLIKSVNDFLSIF